MTAPIRPGPIVPKPPILDGPPVMPAGAFVFPPVISGGPDIKRPNLPDQPDKSGAFTRDDQAAYFASACEQNPDIPTDAFDLENPRDDEYHVILMLSGNICVAASIQDLIDADKAALADAGTVDLGGAPLPANNGD